MGVALLCMNAVGCGDFALLCRDAVGIVPRTSAGTPYSVEVQLAVRGPAAGNALLCHWQLALPGAPHFSGCRPSPAWPHWWLHIQTQTFSNGFQFDRSCQFGKPPVCYLLPLAARFERKEPLGELSFSPSQRHLVCSAKACSGWVRCWRFGTPLSK